MLKILRNSWALFTGLTLMMIAHGLQGNLLGVRAVYENFSLIETGALMSGFYLGYLVGANQVTNIIFKVGHIRVFAAFASLASLSILLHSVFVNPYMWFVSRFISGFCIVGIYTIVESWLNDRATNQTRGKLLSIYMMLLYIGMGTGMFILTFNDPKNYQPFILVSVLMSLALVPILLTKRKAPSFKKIKPLTIKKLLDISPYGTATSFLCGLSNSVIFTLLAVYCASMNFSLFEISLTTFIFTCIGAVSQFPVGYVSDKSDRRKVIVTITVLSSVVAYLIIHYTQTLTDLNSSKLLFYLLIAIFSFLCLPIFSLALSHTNDLIEKDNIVSAGSGLQFLFGVGATSGPIIGTLFMKFFGPNGLFMFVIFIHLLIAIYGIWRIFVKKGQVAATSFVGVSKATSPLAIGLSPEAQPLSEEKK